MAQDPMLPQAQAAPATTTPNPVAQPSGYDRWMKYLQSPTVRSAMMQFGVSMLQGQAPGQSFAGHAGLSLADAGQAAARMQASLAATAKAQREEDRAQRGEAREDVRVGIEKEKAKASAKAEERAILREERLARSDEERLKLDQQRLVLDERRADAYAASVAKSGSAKDPVLDARLDILEEAALEESLVTGEDAMVIFDRKLQERGLLPGTRPATAGGTALTPPPEHLSILKAQPTPENKKFFDEVYGAGAADKVLGGK